MTLTCTNVTLRQKPLRNDRISLYLDYYPAIRNPYTMKMSRWEFLGIYIYAKPKNEQQRMFNQDMLNKAEAIRCIRVQALINEEFGFLDKNKQKVDFLAYFRTKAREKYEKWDCVYNHFEKFVGGKCTFGDVTVELCEKFRDYLLKCKLFKGLTRSMTHHPLKQWIAEAGIRKHITFHCFRHSYAVIQISLGTDIYTVSKMLTHKNVTTTQIYADLVNSKKREMANKISLK